MSNATLWGGLEKLPNGKVVMRRTVIPPEPVPRDEEKAPHLPPLISRGIDRGFYELRMVIGRSMEPTVLEGDWIVIDRRRKRPRNGDVVAIEGANRAAITIVGRYRRDRAGVEWLDKDNRSFESMPFVGKRSYCLAGVVVRTLYREHRRSGENYRAIEERRALHRILGSEARPLDEATLGFHNPAILGRVTPLFDFPASEFAADGRLPWGLLRGRFKVDQPHVGAHAGDWAVISLDCDSKVGDLVLFRTPDGERGIGVLQCDVSRWHDYSHDDRPWWCENLRGFAAFRTPHEATEGKVLRITSAIAAFPKFETIAAEVSR